MSKQLRDKIILVFYVPVDNMDYNEIMQYLEEFQKIFSSWDNDDSVERIIFPSKNGENARVECINPVLLSDEKYTEAEQILNEIKIKVNEFYKENNKNGKTGN